MSGSSLGRVTALLAALILAASACRDTARSQAPVAAVTMRV